MSVMGVNRGTKTWTDQAAQQPAEKDANLEAQSLTPEQKQMLGADDIGAVLNKLSDPNFVDPSKKIRGTGNKEMDKDAFFKLMMTQLKYQDPSNPLKNHEMAAQLAQFSTLEQMSNMNKTLSEIKTGGQPAEQFQALNLIGKVVSGDSARVARTDLDKSHDFKFTLPQDVKSADVKVFNQRGDIVKQFKFAELKSGDNKIVWNGQTERGQAAPAGDYKFQVEALGTNGQKIQAQTGFQGAVSGLSFSPEGAILQIGNQSVRLKDVRQFTDPSLMKNDQIAKNITELDLKKADDVSQTNIKEEDQTAAQKKAKVSDASELLANVNMESGLFNKVKQSLENNSDPEAVR